MFIQKQQQRNRNRDVNYLYLQLLTIYTFFPINHRIIFCLIHSHVVNYFVRVLDRSFALIIKDFFMLWNGQNFHATPVVFYIRLPFVIKEDY